MSFTPSTYIDFTRHLPQSGSSQPIYTTMALNEDGQGNISTMALGEEGGGYHPPGGSVTTFALGEEGGGHFPPGGSATTFALGEEGGGCFPPGGSPTTLALGEEGGGIWPPPPNTPAQQTINYIQVANEADQSGNRDGQVSESELSAQAKTYQQQKQIIGSLIQYFPQFGFIFQKLQNQIDLKSQVADRFLTHFSKFELPNGIVAPDGQVSRTEIIQTAQRDGNVQNVSDRDLNIQTFDPYDMLFSSG